jgi:hypothetical protein
MTVHRRRQRKREDYDRLVVVRYRIAAIRHFVSCLSQLPKYLSFPNRYYSS